MNTRTSELSYQLCRRLLGISLLRDRGVRMRSHTTSLYTAFMLVRSKPRLRACEVCVPPLTFDFFSRTIRACYIWYYSHEFGVDRCMHSSGANEIVKIKVTHIKSRMHVLQISTTYHSSVSLLCSE